MTYVTSSLLVQKVRKLSTSASKANMAETSAKVAKMARNLAIAHIVIGFLLIFFWHRRPSCRVSKILQLDQWGIFWDLDRHISA